jgi:hypothetical protein
LYEIMVFMLSRHLWSKIRTYSMTIVNNNVSSAYLGY